MLENHGPFPLNFSSPVKYSSKERSSQIAPSPQPHTQTKKIPLKTSVHFPITITVCKHWSKFVTCSPSPRDCGVVSHPQRHSYHGFRLCRAKQLSQNFNLLTQGKNETWEGAQVPSNFFGHLKRALELFISVRMSPLAILQDHLVDTMTPGEKKKTKKNKQTNKQAPVICLLAKNTKFHIFVDWTLKFFTTGCL